MAIYHVSAKIISRSKGQSAISSAAYRSGEKLYSERYNETKFYRRDIQPVTFILKPTHAPDWCLNRERLWNEVENYEKSKNAQLS
ncbi:MobA/MobL family protein, partial [Carnobacterium sp. FSL W8-0810]|uniref:MobA/MobL family protein n=1 Tax=Carnobacterium sp. FSL W8-0810 TaxID=2954705 RepID=UPI0030F861CE